MFKFHFSIVISCLLMLSSVSLNAQEKKRLSPDDFPGWLNLSAAQISNDGRWVMYEENPYVGDGTLYLKNPDLGIEKTFDRGYRAKFAPSGKYVAFYIKPQLDSVRKAKLDKVSKSKMPADTFAIYVVETDSLMKFDGVKNFKLASEGSDWLAFQYKKPQKDPKPKAAEGKKKKKKKSKKDAPEKPKSKKKPIKRKTSDLVIFNPNTLKKHQIKEVKEYNVSEYGNSIGYVRMYGDTADSCGVYWFENVANVFDTSFVGAGTAKKPTFREDGGEMVWIHSADTGKAKAYALYTTQGNKGTRIIIDTNDRNLPQGHTVSENGRIYYSRDGMKIFVGTALRPVEEPKDTIPGDEMAKVDVWSYKDLRPQPMQLLQRKRDEKKTHLAVFHVNAQKLVPLGNDSTAYIRPLMQGDNDYALLTQDMDYKLSNSWDFPFVRDYYLLNTLSGDKKLIAKNVGYNTSISPSGKYFVYFDGDGGVWYSVETATGARVEISNGLADSNQVLANMESEIPAKPFAYGIVGWTTNEEWILIETKYDIWRVDPSGEKPPTSLTNGMAERKKIDIDFENFDYDLDYINLDSVMILSGQNLENNQQGFWLVYPKAERIVTLVWGDESFRQLTRARDADRFFYRPMTYRKYPEIYYSSIEKEVPIADQFENCTQVSNVSREYSNYHWGFVKKYYWKDENGVNQKGLLYYPEGFDESKKYPLMVYFYEKYFRSEYDWKPFRPSHSTIAVPMYTSNDYVVLIPDIHYGTGHPGKDGLNAVTSGAKALVNDGFIDEKRMAIQGQSWGGYQVAYIVTQTDMFAAAMAGAPVSNMTSAYGGIRWGSGMSRAFQYEKTQSRIGKDLWEGKDLYLENSPLFYLPNVTTPTLIMHNDNDGAVPYYQGIEMFMGLRRLQKPSWLLVYNKEQHNLRKMPNRLDLSQRMFQFFNHYLKDEPMPKWMSEGVPAVDKGKDYGFEMTK